MSEQATSPKDIAFVVYPGLTPLDLVGPLQVITALTLFTQEYRPVVVGETLDPVETNGPIKLVPDKTFADVPNPSVLIVPGGAAPTMRAMGNDALIAYIRSASERAEVVGSVCTGALILAAAGLMEGRRATTHWSFAKQLGRLGGEYLPERWVEDGRVISSAGISAGIDMALHLVSRLAGEAVARQVQLMIEYDPQPPFGGIDWDQLDRNMFDPVVDRWVTEGLEEKPALLSRLVTTPLEPSTALRMPRASTPVGLSNQPSGRSSDDMPHPNEETLRTIYDALAKGDVNTIMRLLTDDIEFHITGRSPVSGDYSGKEGVLGFIGKLMELSGGTFSVEVLDILANDEHGVTLTMERGQRVGKTLENHAVHVWDMRDGKCVRFYGYNENAWDEFWS